MSQMETNIDIPADEDVDETGKTMEKSETEAKEIPKKPEKKRTSKSQQQKEELDALNDRFLRLMAEYDNYRKRTEKERKTLASLGTSLAVERLLPVLDTLEMAAEANTADLEYKKGVELTAALFASALSSIGVSEIEALGEAFDPTIHNCVASEKSDAHQSGMVIRVMQKGYKLNDHIIRPCMVAVSI